MIMMIMVIIMIILMIMVMTILMVSILQETDGVLLESYLIYEPEHQVIIIDVSHLEEIWSCLSIWFNCDLIYEPDHQVNIAWSSQHLLQPIITVLQQLNKVSQINPIWSAFLFTFLSRPPGSRTTCLFWERLTSTKSGNPPIYDTSYQLHCQYYHNNHDHNDLYNHPGQWSGTMTSSCYHHVCAMCIAHDYNHDYIFRYQPFLERRGDWTYCALAIRYCTSS